MIDMLISIYCLVDDFCKEFEPKWNQCLISSGKKLRLRSSKLALSEIMTIEIAFHLSGFKCFKSFYIFLGKYHLPDFPNLVSYNRFVELSQSIAVPLVALFSSISGKCDGISYIDSTPLPVCHIKREINHNVFKGIAQKSKNTMGWYFGLKLHLIVNKHGQPISFSLSKANVDDRKVDFNIFNKMFGKIYGDRGYISQTLNTKLFNKEIQMLTGLRQNMKPRVLSKTDSDNLSKRSLIEGVFNVLKNIFNMDHTRHRSVGNFFVNICSSLCAYCFRFYEDSKNIRQRIKG
jgi:hypothetical protein